ncbi:fructosamine kinase family protein [Corynebacterium sp.]|uniref:fructosamine kinase family protein n=1 Tax=Corynebacterium sp. TaxID=1720 RepID=UPI0026DD7144|nr:fructosamine kinase family protein [Corynebacterium sp.]MDO5033002.1 fructosamine kinase family protein [Corynebacterium sp.]
MEVYTKHVTHPDQAGAEAAGLRWLAQANPEVVAEVAGVGENSISTRRVRQAPPSPEAAFAFGRALRQVHEAGAEAFGAPPAGWSGANYIGRIEQECTPTESWGEFYVQQRVLPFAEAAPLPQEVRSVVQRAAEAIQGTDWDVAPARIHGDLWAGNVLFTERTAVMIDPAAHGGHPHTDLGMLELFGTPYFSEILRGYGAAEKATRWLPMHQLHPLAVHALTHGPAYYAPLGDAAQATLHALGRS